MFEIRQIIQRLRMGESARQIARSQHVGRATVESIHSIALTQDWLDPLGQIPEDTTLATFFKAPRRAPQNVSSVEPFREEILKWHAQGINATTMRRALHQKHGYSGSVHALYRFLNHEVAETPVATIKLEFAVGEMAQVDFGMGPVITERKTGEILKTWIFVCTLAWSRHQYAEIVRNQSIETWLACHRHAFEWFNGVPKKMRIDNLKAAITKACYYEPTVQRSYGELAIGYSFLIDPCPVEDPRKKGRVESGVKYVKNNFVPLRDFHSVAHANEQLRAWVMSEAGNRIHGSTRERPLKLFAETEQALLQALPTMAPECATWGKAKLHPNCHVQFDYCSYSAPFALIGQTLWLEITPHAIRIYRDHELVAIHPRLFKRGDTSSVRDHLPPDAQAYLMRNPQWCLAQAKSIGPACLALIEILFGNRVLDHLRAAQGVIRLRDQYGRRRLEAACARAVSFGAPQYRAVKQILSQGLDQQPDLIEIVELEAPYRGSGRFSRTPSDRLH
ncbi:MAG TPA: IS21 family transposase [Methyloceanibacter sp.]|nr:IS21 family transposase [Methyloceanibacter sp.]